MRADAHGLAVAEQIEPIDLGHLWAGCGPAGAESGHDDSTGWRTADGCGVPELLLWL